MAVVAAFAHENQNWQVALHALADIDGASVMPKIFYFSSASITACEKRSQWRCRVGMLARGPLTCKMHRLCEKVGEWPAFLFNLLPVAIFQNYAK